ncbi:hypothetical protein QF015_000476 [Paenarthrobacter sp. TE4293]
MITDSTILTSPRVACQPRLVLRLVGTERLVGKPFVPVRHLGLQR